MAKRTAIIDIGSNSVRMVIFERTSRFAFHLIHEAKSRVRICENAYENNNTLQEKALDRAYKALSEFLLTIKKHKVNKTLCVATSALREAPNKQDFISKIYKELGLHIKIIDGEKEAYLGGIAAANLLHLESGMTVDIGGGSTELAFYENRKVIHTLSLNLGTVRLKELYFDNKNIAGAKEHILKEFSKLPQTLKHENIIGIGGTLRALSKMIMQKEKVYFRKLHGFSYPISQQQSYFKDILQADEAKLKKLGVKDERLDVIQPGLLILDLLIEHLDAKQITTSGVGVREGLFLSDLLRKQQDKFPANFNPSIKSLLDRFTHDESNQLCTLASRLFDLSAELLNLSPSYKPLFLNALKLSQIGKDVDFYESHRHAYYLLLNGLSYGFSHEDTVLMSTLVRFQRKKSPSASHMENYKNYLPSKETTAALSFLMTVSQSVFTDIDHGKNITMSIEEGCLNIKVKQGYLIREKLKDILKNEYLNLSVS